MIITCYVKCLICTRIIIYMVYIYIEKVFWCLFDVTITLIWSVSLLRLAINHYFYYMLLYYYNIINRKLIIIDMSIMIFLYNQWLLSTGDAWLQCLRALLAAEGLFLSAAAGNHTDLLVSEWLENNTHLMVENIMLILFPVIWWA